MASSAAALKAQFDFQTRLFNNVLNGITDETSNNRPNGHVNNMKWIAGHMLNSRINSLANFTGNQPDTTYAAQFARGTTLDTANPYPTIEEIVSKWNEAAPVIGAGLAGLSEEVLDSKAPYASPIADETYRGLLSFFVSHEAMHIGQLSLLRKMNGGEPLTYR